jgi:hypothetical protein
MMYLRSKGRSGRDRLMTESEALLDEDSRFAGLVNVRNTGGSRVASVEGDIVTCGGLCDSVIMRYVGFAKHDVGNSFISCVLIAYFIPPSLFPFLIKVVGKTCKVE